MEDTLHLVLEKHGFWQTIRITSWAARFIQNCKKGKNNWLSGTLTTCETDKQVKFQVGRAQNSRLNTDEFLEDQLKLNLQKNEEGFVRVQRKNPGKLPYPLTTRCLVNRGNCPQ